MLCIVAGQLWSWGWNMKLQMTLLLLGEIRQKAFLKKSSFKFIATICLLRDFLEILGKLSKCFQKDIDIHQVNSMISATKETIAVFQGVDAEPATVLALLDDIEVSDKYHGIERFLDISAPNKLGPHKLGP